MWQWTNSWTKHCNSDHLVNIYVRKYTKTYSRLSFPLKTKHTGIGIKPLNPWIIRLRALMKPLVLKSDAQQTLYENIQVKIDNLIQAVTTKCPKNARASLTSETQVYNMHKNSTANVPNTVLTRSATCPRFLLTCPNLSTYARIRNDGPMLRFSKRERKENRFISIKMDRIYISVCEENLKPLRMNESAKEWSSRHVSKVFN